MKTTYIYSLSFPEGNIRYIGKSDEPKKRLRNHIYEAKRNKWNSHKNNWIRQLLNEGNKPIIEILEEVEIEKWEDCEKYWINQIKALNFDLVNVNEGGSGIKFHTNITRKLMSEQRKGKNIGKKGNFKKGCVSWNKGLKLKTSLKKGKTFEEMYGKEKSELLKKENGLFKKGNKNNFGKKWSYESVNNISKEYSFVDEKGNIFQGKNLKKFSIENNYNQSHLHSVMSGKRKSHKGLIKKSYIK